MQHNTAPHSPANFNHELAPPPEAEQLHATESFVRRTAYIGNTALHTVDVEQTDHTTLPDTIRATARPVEGTLAAPTVSQEEMNTLTPGELSARLASVGTPAKAKNVAAQLYGRAPHTEREKVQTTMLASMMQRNQPKQSWGNRARNLFSRR
jgi:hypothetical protein